MPRRHARYHFDPELEYLCKVADAWLEANPTLGPGPPTYSLVIKLIVIARLGVGARPDIVSQEAVISTTVDDQLRFHRKDVTRLVDAMGIRLTDAPDGACDFSDTLLACTFGRQCKFGYQNLGACRTVDPANYEITVHSPKVASRFPPGLEWDDDKREVWLVGRPQCRAKFGRHRVPYQLFKVIAAGCGKRCSYDMLISSLMTRRRPEAVESGTISKHCRLINRVLANTSLRLECDSGQGYRLII